MSVIEEIKELAKVLGEKQDVVGNELKNAIEGINKRLADIPKHKFIKSYGVVQLDDYGNEEYAWRYKNGKVDIVIRYDKDFKYEYESADIDDMENWQKRMMLNAIPDFLEIVKKKMEELIDGYDMANEKAKEVIE